MLTSVHLRGLFTLTAAVGLAGLALAAPAPRRPVADTIKERKGFIPYRKYEALPGKVTGLLVSDVQAMMGQEGRSGPPDAMGFSANGNSYRWMYVPVGDNVRITNLRVPVGEKGDQFRVYPRLNMASLATVKQWDVDVPYALVEVEVNDGLGSPAGESFVATRMKRLDGTKDYPLKVPDVVSDLRKRYKRYLDDEKKAIDAALSKQQEAALKDRKPTGPRESKDVVFFTWLPKEQHLRVHFKTRISDGAYQFIQGGVRPRPVPLPLPPKRQLAAPPATLPPAPVARRPPPPPRFRVRVGTTFGVEFGMAYEVDKTGKLVKISTLPFEGFQQELPVPPGAAGALPPAPKND